MLAKLYDESPIFVQNLMVSTYGTKLFYERYFGRSRKFLKQLQVSQWFSAEQVGRLQREKLGALLRHAGATVPYYRQLFQAISFDPAAGIGLGDLNALPLLSKETVRTSSRALVSSLFPKSALVPLNTSGTTGKTLKIFVDLPSRRNCYCFTSRFHQWAGLADSRHNATFGGRTLVPQGQAKKVFWRYNAAMDNYLFSTYHMSEENLPFFLEKLRRIRPRFIEAYPSAAFLLGRYILDRGGDVPRPKAVITSGETLLENQRDVIMRAFECPVFDQYGCTEQALFVSQCEYGTYHVHPEFGLVEILDDDGNLQAEGVPGRVVCTSFMNRAMPLVRYDLGDTASWRKGSCACGRNFPILEKIYGRREDLIRTPDGKLVGRLDPIFKGLDSVRCAQIIQEELNRIVIKIVPGESFNSDDGRVIKTELSKRLGFNIDFELEIVKQIPNSKNGKFKAVISKIK